jgi:hypothetical protein
MKLLETRFDRNLARFLSVLLVAIFIAIGLTLTGCNTAKPGVSYTKVFKEQKGLKHTFLLDQKGLIWVLNYERHCLPMNAEIMLTFTEEIPYKRFRSVPYQVQELHGYNCDGDYAILADLDSPLVGLLRTMRLKTIRVKTLNTGTVNVNVDGERIFQAVASLKWKTPIPKPEDDFTK